MMWISEVSEEAAFRATRVLVRATSMPKVVATWAGHPSFLALFVDGKPHPNVVIGGPEAIRSQIQKHMPAKLVARIDAALMALWADPRREETMLALVVWTTPTESLVAIQVDPAALGVVVDPPVKPAALPAGASPEDRRRWLRKTAAVAIDRVGGANMRSCAARDEVAIVAIEADGEISYGYAPRAKYAADFPEPVKLRPGETAACHAILVDMGGPGEDAPYEAFRMVAHANIGPKRGAG